MPELLPDYDSMYSLGPDGSILFAIRVPTLISNEPCRWIAHLYNSNGCLITESVPGDLEIYYSGRMYLTKELEMIAKDAGFEEWKLPPRLFSLYTENAMLKEQLTSALKSLDAIQKQIERLENNER